MPGALTPSLQESAVRLGAWVPFPQAAPLLAHFTHTTVSEPTVRRRTEQAGAACVAVQTAVVEALERDAPPPPQGPPLQQLSVDGAMVPLVGTGVWAEVKTLAVGTVRPPVLERGQPVVHTGELSYFSRLADHRAFARLALAETHRRGVATAGRVAAVNDGAPWIQGFVDYHRPDAVRILDWGHAAGYLGDAATACSGAGSAAAGRWLDTQLRELLAGDPDNVLGELRGLRDDLAPQAADAAARATLDTLTTGVQYLEARRAQLAYAAFRAAGYPIGSGSVESAHAVVVEARLKGAGMHWAPAHVDPMLALRNAVCNDRWAEAWPQIAAELRRQQRERLRAKRHRRRARAAPAPAPRPATGA
ncbi:MAG TPA: ISKra4 family transposase, partial [Vicinamibacteria bacterium]